MKTFKTKRYSLNFETWGNPNDRPALFFHGFPGSHAQARGLEPFLKENKMYLIAFDRPGYGRSTGKGTPLQLVEALRELLNSLEIRKFEIIGVSGGAPWAHIMASKFADDVLSLTIICGLGTYNAKTRPYFSNFQKKSLALTKFLPRAVTNLILDTTAKRFHPEKKLKALARFLCAADRAVIQDVANQSLIADSMVEGRAQGAKGIAQDIRLYRRDWLKKECDLKKLAAIPTVYFHGKEDRILDYRLSEWMHKANPKSRLLFFDDEGHYSIAFAQAKKILVERLNHNN